MLERLKLEEGWSTLFLVWLMVFITGVTIHQADLIPGLEILTSVATAAVVAGLLLAKSRFSDGTAHLFSLIYGLALITYMLGGLLPEHLTWQERAGGLIARQVEWLSIAFGEGTARDGLVFVMHTAVIFWVLGYTAAWYTFRKPRVWGVVLPSGMVLLSVVYYYFGPRPLALYLGVYMVAALLYVSRTHLVAQEKSWRAAAVRYDGDIRYRFLRASFMVATIALLVSWNLPTMTASAAVNDALSGAGVNDGWRKFQDNWTRLFSSLRSYGGATSDPFLDSLVLGGPRSVGNTPIMDIYVKEQLPYAYWHATVRDTYQNGGWEPPPGQRTIHYPEDGALTVPFSLSRDVVTQTVVNYIPNASTLYGMPEIIASDRQMVVTAGGDESGNLLVTSVQSRYALRQGDIYQVQSRYSMADAHSLREASANYPDWIQARYLQLPDTITPETLALAEGLASRHDNAYDKSIAIRDYLRHNIVYNDQIEAPPQDVEPIHHFLFVEKQGYCNYYATAMVLMLRAQGVPARMALGYAAGEFDENSRSYRVRASNAHAWVEVYFPGYGWVPFEPTASLASFDRPEGGEDDGDSFASPSFGSGIDERDRSDFMPLDDLEAMGLGGEAEANELTPLDLEALLGQDGADTAAAGVPIWQMVGALLVVMVAAVAMVAANQMNKQVESSVEKSYGRLESWGQWLGVLFQPVHTPYERADLLSTAVPQGRTSIRKLTQQFVLRQFSRSRAGDTTFDPQQEWQTLRPLLLRQSIRHLIQRLRQRD